MNLALRVADLPVRLRFDCPLTDDELFEPAEVHKNPASVRGTGPVSGFELVMGRVWG